jgi:hypothetical protein
MTDKFDGEWETMSGDEFSGRSSSRSSETLIFPYKVEELVEQRTAAAGQVTGRMDDDHQSDFVSRGYRIGQNKSLHGARGSRGSRREFLALARASSSTSPIH